jgi:thiol:disulfide interchange protein DsbD
LPPAVTRNRVAIREAFAASGHALFKADWTRRDETIRSKLAEFGRAGVPLYLVYSPQTPNDPEVLSELLSQGEVRAALARSVTTDES